MSPRCPYASGFNSLLEPFPAHSCHSSHHLNFATAFSTAAIRGKCENPAKPTHTGRTLLLFFKRLVFVLGVRSILTEFRKEEVRCMFERFSAETAKRTFATPADSG